MKYINFFYIQFFIVIVHSGVIPDDDVDEQGLYSKSDFVNILTPSNFDRKVYGQKHALIIQFYNSYCGHCRHFAPRFKIVASEIVPWKKILQLAVLDCSIEENNEICRLFEVMAYPTVRYLHENYAKGNTNLGDKLESTETAEKFKEKIIYKMQTEQASGYLRMAPSLRIASYSSISAAIKDNPPKTMFTFLVFESYNSTMGSQLALDINDYQNVKVKRVLETSELASKSGIHAFPAVLAVKSNLETSVIKYKTDRLLRAVNLFLKNNRYVFPVRDQDDIKKIDHSDESAETLTTDTVYYSDLEKTIKMSLHTEITKYRLLKGDAMQALLNYLDVIIISFPARGNLKEFLKDLRQTVASKPEWTGNEVFDLVKSLEIKHAPVYITKLEYIHCKGSHPRYRGYTCGLWSLFHTLLVNAAQKPGLEAPKVLRAMRGYIKNFFGCTTCSEHFSQMVEKYKLFDVKDNEKAVLWLWIAHNDVNLRLAGDDTEDPRHPKIQYPSPSVCPKCRQGRGAWNLPAVYQYLQSVYSAENIQYTTPDSSPAVSPSPFSNLDIGMLSLLDWMPKLFGKKTVHLFHETSAGNHGINKKKSDTNSLAGWLRQNV